MVFSNFKILKYKMAKLFVVSTGRIFSVVCRQMLPALFRLFKGMVYFTPFLLVFLLNFRCFKVSFFSLKILAYRNVLQKECIFKFLTHFSPVIHFCTRCKCQNTKGFLTFSGDIEMEHWAKMC